MNRLILIGNGFDLAHGMKTSYKDFILSYLKHGFSVMLNQSYFEDDLIKIYSNPSGFKEHRKIHDLQNWEITDFSTLLINHDPFISNIDTRPSPWDLSKYVIHDKSDLIRLLITNCSDYRWVDIENEYYSMLCNLSAKNEHEKIKKLNLHFEYIQYLLANYLEKIEHNYLHNDSEYFRKGPLVEQLSQIFKGSYKDIEILGKNHPGIFPQRLLILNFNYTETITDYIKELKNNFKEIKVINIHGKLKDENNPMIFGYGDEDETNFSLLEKFDDCLHFVKTYRYTRTHNYQDFLDFIKSDQFDVFVLGHSCGLSDKTLLSEVFNNDNCYKIRLLTYNKNESQTINIDSTDYVSKTYQIGRIFKNKAAMREKLIPFTPADVIRVERT
ncbi:MAG: hypothetical protein ABS44_09195 [Chryseobacterium sp. SCN 40-13]|nr:MAG: hypothetical protein ABS44_09195 [Chryseobacterium sp. SCN 40-13]